jgi:hypothetical protein
MINLASWNIRGLNRPLKQKEVQFFMRENLVNFCAILESRVDVKILFKICVNIFRAWEWTSNGGLCSKGTRIIVGWDPNLMQVMVLFQSNQVMHLQIIIKSNKNVIFCSIIYADNYYGQRKILWDDLVRHKSVVKDAAWILMVDFNSTLFIDDKSCSSSRVDVGMLDFRKCVDQIEMYDVKGVGLHYTWSQKPKAGTGVLKKLDRIMANNSFIDLYPAASALFQSYRVSDHCPCVLRIPIVGRSKPKPFKFPNFLADKPDFNDVVTKGWAVSINGIAQFKVVKKLRLMKTPLRALLNNQGNLHKKVVELRDQLDNIQQMIYSHPYDSEHRAKEVAILKDFQAACKDEEMFLKQKAKVHWLA